MNDKQKLLKTDNRMDISESLSIQKKYRNSRSRIRKLCRILAKESDEFSPKGAIDYIENYTRSEDTIDRILYSQITSFIFELDEWDRDTFISNADSMLNFALNEKNNVSEDISVVTIKIYDHIQLAFQQITSEERIFAQDIEDAKENIREDTKGIEKEYITILGIFAAIVLAFVGGITFSSSVLQSIDAVSPYRLFITIALLGLILINTISLLIKMIFRINMDYEDFANIKWINWLLIIIIIVIMLAWIFNIGSLPDYIDVPWHKSG